MTTNRFGRISSLAAAVLLGSVPLAGSAFADSTPRAHEGGVFLRLSAGPGGAKTSIDNTPLGKWELSGASGDLNFAIGGMIGSNLALHGTLWGWSTTDPDVKIEDLGSGNLNGDLGLTAVGAGVTYYFMPANLYLSGSIGAAWLTVDSGSSSADTGAGVGIDVTLGKEWWVGNSWGLGVALGLGAHSIPEDQVDENWTGGSAGLRFTATMN